MCCTEIQHPLTRAQQIVLCLLVFVGRAKPPALCRFCWGFSHFRRYFIARLQKKNSWKKRACFLTSGKGSCCAIVTQCLALRSCPCGDVSAFNVVERDVSIVCRLKLQGDGNVLHSFDSICSSVAGTVFNILQLVVHTVPFYGLRGLLPPWQTCNFDPFS